MEARKAIIDREEGELEEKATQLEEKLTICPSRKGSHLVLIKKIWLNGKVY
jgi:hypothetical protein